MSKQFVQELQKALPFSTIVVFLGSSHWNAPPNLSVGIVESLGTLPEIVRTRASTSPAGRQDIVRGTRLARIVGKRAIWPVIVKTSLCRSARRAICSMSEVVAIGGTGPLDATPDVHPPHILHKK